MVDLVSLNCLMYSGACKFVNPIEFSTFVHKYNQNNQSFTQVLQKVKDNLIKQMRLKYYTWPVRFEENDPKLHVSGKTCEPL